MAELHWKAPRHVVGLMALRGAIACVLGILSPVLVYVVAVLLSNPGSAANVSGLILALAGCLAIMGILPSLSNLIDSQVARAFSWRNQSALHHSIEAVAQLSAFEDPEYQELLQGASDAADAYVRGAVVAVSSVVQTVTALGGVLWLLARQDWAMALIPMVCGAPAIYFFSRASTARMACFVDSLHARRKQMRFRAVATDMTTLGELKVARAETFIGKQALNALADAHGIELKSELRISRDQFVASLLTAAAAASPLLLALGRGVEGSFQMAVIIQAAIPLSSSFTQIGTLVAALSQAYRERKYLRVYLDRCDDERARCAPSAPNALSSRRIRSIVFEDVWFRYPGARDDALQGLSLTLQQGRSYALIGENGSGKSTVLKLIAGLYYPTRGRILIDGHDVRSLNLTDLRDRVAYLAQDSVRLDLSIRENLLMGADSPGDLEAALGMVGLGELGHRSDKGLQTVLSQTMVDADETGTMISGGQWRRLAAARYWLRAERDVCLLDEPTNAVDAEGEEALLNGALAPRPGSIWLAVTHRPAVCRVADETLLLAHGRLRRNRPVAITADKNDKRDEKRLIPADTRSR